VFKLKEKVQEYLCRTWFKRRWN